MALDFQDKIDEISQTIETPESMLGSGLRQPFAGANSGARKIMFSIHSQHILPLMKGEKAIIETGYETKFGDYSSSITKTDSDYQVIAKISKFSFAPNHHYWLILRDTKSNKLDVVERISYEFITESYGYLYNNEYLDSLQVGNVIKNNTIVQKSLAFDEYNNRTDGTNFNICYLNLDKNMEDSIVISDVAAGKLSSPLIRPVEVMINTNDIPLNIYGDDNHYKVFPDIGESTVNSKLIALRKEKKDEAFFNQSVERLKKIVMSDDVKQAPGKVIDVDIYCNNPEILNGYYYSQLKLYYDELQRRSQEIVQVIMPLVSAGYKLSYDLEKLYILSSKVFNKEQYFAKKAFSNIILKITVLEEKAMEAGDKASNRYGGKGVISDILPQWMMPRFKNARGEYEYVDVIFNTSTMYGRENIGQIFELSLTHIGQEIIYRIMRDKCSLDESIDMIYKYINICSPQQAEFFKNVCNSLSRDDLAFYIQSFIDSGAIQLSMKPISDYMSIDKLAELYKLFPWVKLTDVETVLIGSDGTPRYVHCRRPIMVGKQYILRLKQFAEEKFSATSLSSTNIRNENIKSRNKKEFKDMFSNTPIRFGNMEASNMEHAGIEAVITNLMIHSVSPQGRRLVEQMYTCDPFDIDIKLDSNSRNRAAEICNVYLKVIGQRLVFKKRFKQNQYLAMQAITFHKDPFENPLVFAPKDIIDDKEKVKQFFKEEKEMEEKRKTAEHPLDFNGGERNIDESVLI